jgi:DGQHR domain-containing protein
VFRGREVRGLSLKVPALRTRMGSLTCYTFSVRPDYLLKIAYVAHRAKGKAFDVDAYQRMLSKYRLKKIADYISDDGVFPTNIVINVADQKHLRFDRGKQEGALDDTGGQFGWLTLSPTYGSAWVIDGQHRLFAYSGHERASSSYLNVLAFQGLSPSRQTELFVDINSEQRRVKRSLLVELDATLKWDSDDDATRLSAIISKVGMRLDEVAESPLRGRILLADARRTPTRCVSLTAVFTALHKPGFFIVSKKKGVTLYGPLWRDDPMQCMRRTAKVLVAWLRTVADEADDWWQLGAEEGGGLAMNDGVTVCINVLRSVLEHLNANGTLLTTDDADLVARLEPYAKALGADLARMSPEDRLRFRRFRGVEGQTNATRECQLALQDVFPNYQAEGLSDWATRRDANTNEEARRIIDEVERAVQERLLDILKDEFDADENAWWFEGVPKLIRKKVDDRINEAGGGRREESFDFIHYEAMIKHKWQLLKPIFSYGDANRGKEQGTAWLREIAAWRNKVMHPSRRDFLGIEELNRLQEYQEWLRLRLQETADEPT